jgi:hypothetical protein
MLSTEDLMVKMRQPWKIPQEFWAPLVLLHKLYLLIMFLHHVTPLLANTSSLGAQQNNLGPISYSEDAEQVYRLQQNRTSKLENLVEL